MRRVAIVLREQFCTIILGRESQFLLCLTLPRARLRQLWRTARDSFLPEEVGTAGAARVVAVVVLFLSLSQQHRQATIHACVSNLQSGSAPQFFIILLLLLLLLFFSLSTSPPPSLPSDPHPARFLTSAKMPKLLL